MKIHIFTKCTDFLLKLSDISLNLTDAKIVESYNNKKYKNKKRIPGGEISCNTFREKFAKMFSNGDFGADFWELCAKSIASNRQNIGVQVC